MKFDFVIGNPPYQDETIGDNVTFAPPVYHMFMDAAYEIGNKVELITPARFLFNAGKTPKQWNQKMLNDEHFKTLFYTQKSKELFTNTDIKGGVVITYRDNKSDFGAIEVFTTYPELNSIMKKAAPKKDKDSLMNIVYAQNRYISEKLFDEYPECKERIGIYEKDNRFESNIFEKFAVFTNEKVNDDDIRIIGVMKNKRVWKYFPLKFLDMNHENIKKFKVLVPASNGSGSLGEVISTPLIGTPLIGYTRTFIGIGAFDTAEEAENATKYIKSKFCRTMLGILKITQSNKKATWKYVPLQNFTNDSDIDWSTSIKNIDKQLYKKYGLSQEEIDFIESKVQAME